MEAKAMNVASLELCKELYELSGWIKADDWGFRKYSAKGIAMNYGSRLGKYEIPAYDLGYLLRKLPKTVPNDDNGGSYYFDLHFVPYKDSGDWTACYDNAVGVTYKYDAFADTPEDAACKLAIELFKQEILK
jgi:hypothetical protein